MENNMINLPVTHRGDVSKRALCLQLSCSLFPLLPDMEAPMLIRCLVVKQLMKV